MRLYRQDPIKGTYHSVKFGSQRQSGCGDMFLVCLVISQYHMIKGSCEFMGGSLPWYVTTLAKLISGQRHCGWVTTLPSLMAKDIVIVEVWSLKGKIPHALAYIRHYRLSLKHTTCKALTHGISGLRHNRLPVCSMKDVRSWSHVLTWKTDGNYTKNFCQSVQNRDEKEKEKKKTTTRKTTAKAFALHSNIITAMHR